ncbi:phosducin-like protein [Nilaparvata lugens]|uniref:phosducin-like protein n=1 Tax=Nilaparvata lugens TaxID=108931 RepID=UPI000B983E01|nr:phosducin-like protein [Nilaparvata lugens]
MASLEDKILGEKKHYYCDSSSDDGGGESDAEGVCDEASGGSAASNEACKNLTKWDGVSSNTGPKGVIKDWQRFKQMETEKREEDARARLNLMKKLSITCKSDLDNQKEEDADKELSELLDDEFIAQYRKQRMAEMLSEKAKLPIFGKLIHLNNGDEFLEAVDNESKSVTVIVHIYEDRLRSCKNMNKCLVTLSDEYNQIKFCKLVGSSAGMSSHFKSDGVPALLIYKAGQMVGNFVRVTDDLGEEFEASDVENFLIEHGMILDKSFVPKIITDNQNDDSDVSLD